MRRTGDLDDAKAALRDLVLAERRNLSAADLAHDARMLAELIMALPEVEYASVVAAYVSVGREPGTGPLLDRLEERGLQILLPIISTDHELDWGRYGGSHALAPASRGLLEPVTHRLGLDAIAEADVVIVPALAVDRRGRRLGRGGGYYDHALMRVRADTITVAMLHEGEILDLPVPHDHLDISVRAAATPSAVVRFGYPH